MSLELAGASVLVICLFAVCERALSAAPPDASIVIQSGGTLDGNGLYEVTHGVWMESGSTLAPGYPLGRLSISGTLNLGANSNTVIQIGGKAAGTNYDQVSASGAVTIAGNLEVQLSNSTPSVGDTFTILAAGSWTGTFAMFCGPALGARRTLRPNYGATDVVLSVELIATYAEWKCSRFTFDEQSNPLISGPLADPDRDGIPNEIEYFFATEPKDPNSIGRVEISIVTEADSKRYFRLTFPRAQGVTDVNFTVERTADLSNPVELGDRHARARQRRDRKWRGCYHR
jgi:hypothetical protein